MIGADLATTSDPAVLVPGSIETLHTDADDLDRTADAMGSAAEDVTRLVVPGWLGDAADGWAERRALVEESLAAVAEILRSAAAAVRAHADVLAWGRERAAVAVELWAGAPQLTASGGLTRRPTAAGLRLAPTFVLGDGDPFGVRRMAEAVLADARHEVARSAEAAAAVLDALCEGMPDGRWHADQLAVGLVRDWLVTTVAASPSVMMTRALVDPVGVASEVYDQGEAFAPTAETIVAHPDQAVPLLLDTQTLEDNPARWWGGNGPDLALTAAGAGAAVRALRSAGRAAPQAARSTSEPPPAPVPPPAVPPVPSPRRFTSGDPLVGELATRLDALRPGWVRDVNNNIRMHDGNLREVDIDLGDVVVQVKSENARGLIGQMNATRATTDRIPVGYAPTIRHGALAEAGRQGLLIARTPEELITMIESVQ